MFGTTNELTILNEILKLCINIHSLFIFIVSVSAAQFFLDLCFIGFIDVAVVCYQFYIILWIHQIYMRCLLCVVIIVVCWHQFPRKFFPQ